MRGQGHQIFVDELARFAADTADARVAAIARSAAAPLRVAVRGRGGVGCGTVARALDRAGATSGIRAAESPLGAPSSADVADVVVYVTTEVLKPEDRDAISAERRPVLVVLNKADLTGFAGDGPVVAALARCAQFSALVGVSVQPMIGLLAVVAVDEPPDAVWSAVFTTERRWLLRTLGVFGTAVAVAAVRKGWTPAQLRALFRSLSCVDTVVAGVNALGAEVRYRRVLDAVAELEALAVGAGPFGERIGEFLAHDDTVLARMAAATDLDLGPDGDGSGDLHRACAADITRGSLRLRSRAGVGGTL
jgi:hypothetical protein